MKENNLDNINNNNMNSNDENNIKINTNNYSGNSTNFNANNQKINTMTTYNPHNELRDIMLEKINELELKLDIKLSQQTAYTNELANKIELVKTKVTQNSADLVNNATNNMQLMLANFLQQINSKNSS